MSVVERKCGDCGRAGPAGDQVSHVEWRLRNGEMPIRHGPKVFVIMIGTNDLGAAACNPGVGPITDAAPGVTFRWAALLYRNDCDKDPNTGSPKIKSALGHNLVSVLIPTSHVVICASPGPQLT
jgi:hypothetical protein